MKNTTKTLSIIVIVSAVLLFTSCNPIENKSKSASMLTVENLQGTDSNGQAASYLQSDVLKSDSTVTADTAAATLSAASLDPDPLMGTSQYSDILVTRYTVSYSRTDGKNVPGVDVPYPFEGSLSVLVKSGSSATFSLIVVREVAKLEPPLVALADSRAEGVLQVTARIDFYGQDLARRTVTATGYLAIFFANYADTAAAPTLF
jgi:hypothetical protein